ncbi:MAG: amidohydrolase family protein [Planctomycetota bacterium]|nr:MAG: amidohydrolase family protein [Planctomycetota bacterium]
MTLLYDVHTHVGLDQAFYLRGWWPYAATAQDLLQHLDACGIARAVCFPMTMPSAFDPYAFIDRQEVELLPGRIPFDRENALLVQELERVDTERRLLPFAMFDPSRLVTEQLRNLEKLVGKIKGLKTQTTIIESPIRSLLDEGKELMAFAEQHELPVLLHATVNPQAVCAQASDCLAVAEAFPGVRFCLAHSLGFHKQLLLTAAGMTNVWIDSASLLAHCQLALGGSLIATVPAQRVDADYRRPVQVMTAIYEMLDGCYLWGSDNPFMSWFDDELKIMYSYRQEAEILHALPESVRKEMGSLAPRRWLYGENAGEP